MSGGGVWFKDEGQSWEWKATRGSVNISQILSWTALPAEAAPTVYVDGRRMRTAGSVQCEGQWVSVCVGGGLRGGKGGFGALLRHGAHGQKSKKVTDFGACRDLQGRRLRHANMEEQLREWAKRQEEVRKLSKQLAEAKRAERMKKKEQAAAQYAAQSESATQATLSALDRGLQRRTKVNIDDAAAVVRNERDSKRAESSVFSSLFDDDEEDDNEEDDNDEAGKEDGAEKQTSAAKRKGSSSSHDEEWVVEDIGVATCDRCDVVIEGVRWRCTDCEDYDLCDKCYQEGNHSSGAHTAVHTTFLRILQSLPEGYQ